MPGMIDALFGNKTVPEAPQTVKAQHSLLNQGKRPAVMHPHGTPEPPLNPNMRRVDTTKGSFHFNPSMIHEGTIHHAVQSGRENDILGLGPFSKDDVAARLQTGEQPLSLVERDPNGVEIRAASGTSGLLPAQLAAMSRDKVPSSSFHIENPDHTILLRLLAGK